MPTAYDAIGARIPASGGERQWHQHGSGAAGLAGGRFVVTYEDDGYGREFVNSPARVFNSFGHSVGYGSAYVSGSISQYSPVVAPLANGGYVHGVYGLGRYEARFFDSFGNPTSPQFVVGGATSSGIAGLSEGGVVFCWVANAGDGSGTAVVAQIISAAGEPVGASFIVNTNAAGDQTSPRVTALAGGSFVVAWTDPAGDASGSGVKAQIFTASGARVGAEFLVNTTVTGAQSAWDVVTLSDGTFVVFWGSATGLMTQRFQADGTRVGGESQLPLTGLVAALPGGGFVVVANAGTGATVQVFDNSSLPTGAPTHIEGSFVESLAVSPDGSILISWTGSGFSGGDVYAQVLFPATGTTGADLATDSAGNDVLVTIAGDDTLQVTAGDDRVNGGTGSDTLRLLWQELTTDVRFSRLVSPDEQGGSQGLITTTGRSVDFRSIERFDIRTGSGNDVFTTGDGADLVQSGGGQDVISTGAGNDFISGGEGNDILNGGTGLDITDGGLGNDVHYVDTVDDIVTERAGEGRDFVYASGNYSLRPGTEVEVLIAADRTSLDNVNLRGNEFANIIHASDGANILYGGAGNDVILGYSGNDNIDGGTGADNLAGGLGDDIYHIDSANDVVVEREGEGRDRIYTSVSYNLREIEQVELVVAAFRTATTVINITGNSLNNILGGNSGANILNGGGGDDILQGFEGDDNLSGGAGADNMAGGLGDDVYHVDNPNDVVVENAGEGRDRIFSTVSYNLREIENVELLSTEDISGHEAINFRGNSIDNIIRGNEGVNILNGGGGADVLLGLGGDDFLDGGTGADNLTGGLGDDIYFVDSVNDVIVELAGEGRDRVFVTGTYILRDSESIEVISIADREARLAINITGNSSDNIISGGAGRNTLDGRAGNDTLLGFEDGDIFAFTTALDGRTNVDTIVGFEIGYDKIWIDDAIFTGLQRGALPLDAFVVGSAALDANDRIILNPEKGSLLFDPDGVGGQAAIQFAILEPGLNLTGYDFLVF